MEELLNSVAEEEGFSQYKIEHCSGSAKGDGYLGLIQAVRIVGNDRTCQDKVLNIVVKSASKSDTLRKETPLEGFFAREIHMYKVVFPAFRKLEIEKGLSSFHFAPKFYKGSVEKKNEALVLENLKEDGYKLYERRIPMNEEHVSLVMMEYGRFHALSLALRDQNLKEFKRIAAMDDIFIKFNKQANFIQSFVERFRKIQDIFNSKADEKAIQVFDVFIDSIESFFDKLLESVDEHSVVLHGDCWTTNMLFKYSDKDNLSQPTDIRFIDFQLARLGSPVLDLSFFFYTCSSKKIINNLDHYLRLYYDSLSAYLLKLGSDPLKVFPYDVLKRHWKLYARSGLILSSCIIYMMLSEKDETVDLADVAESGEIVGNAFNYEIASADTYNNRMIDIILHFIENEFI